MLIIVLLLLLCLGYIGNTAFTTYRALYTTNITRDATLCVPTGATVANVADTLRARGLLLREATFEQAVRQEHCTAVRAGRYQLTHGMTNSQVVRMLKMGWQAPVNIVIAGAIRSREKLAAVLSRTIEADSATMFHALTGEPDAWSMMVPNTYEVYWNITPDDLLQRLYKEYEKFWDAPRTAAQEASSLTRAQIITLASIVNEETNNTAEMPRIAGVYINRLHRGMPLQADPTLKYAWGDFTIRRVLDRHKLLDSPYNTYIHAGLPPAPVCVPSIAAIDAVLHCERHDYLFFCAAADFSGSHVFAKTLAQHNLHADKYRQALNQHNIYK